MTYRLWAEAVEIQDAEVEHNACPLRHEWRSWSPEKRADRVFMVCPACGHQSSHVERIEEDA